MRSTKAVSSGFSSGPRLLQSMQLAEAPACCRACSLQRRASSAWARLALGGAGQARPWHVCDLKLSAATCGRQSPDQPGWLHRFAFTSDCGQSGARLRRRCRAGTSDRKAAATWKSLSNRWSRMHHCRFHCSVVVSISLRMRMLRSLRDLGPPLIGSVQESAAPVHAHRNHPALCCLASQPSAGQGQAGPVGEGGQGRSAWAWRGGACAGPGSPY